MESDRASWTALGAASNRAMHLFVDDPPPILRDEWALRGLAVIRNRYAEDRLRRAIARGVRQYVLLGAGLDSFAHREPALAGQVAVFEVDHPFGQRAKQEMLSDLRAPSAPSLVYVPVDFETESLADRLGRAGFRRDLPAFFSWLGVTIYLSGAAIFSTLEFVRRCAWGTEIVFEYSLPLEILPREEQQLLRASIARCEARGERFESYFEPHTRAARLQALGFTEVVDFGPKEAREAYLAGRSDSLWFSELSHLMRASVGMPACGPES